MRFDRLISCSIFKKSCKNDGVPQNSPKLVKTSNNSYNYYYNVKIGKSINIHNCTSNSKLQTNWMRFDLLFSRSIFKKSCKNDGVPQKPPKLTKTSNNSYIYYYNVNIGHSINTCNSTSNINAISRWDKNGPNLPILAGIVYI